MLVSHSLLLGHTAWLTLVLAHVLPVGVGCVLSLVRYTNGKQVATQWRNTTGAPAALRISVKDNVGSSLIAGCADAAYVQVSVRKGPWFWDSCAASPPPCRFCPAPVLRSQPHREH